MRRVCGVAVVLFLAVTACGATDEPTEDDGDRATPEEAVEGPYVLNRYQDDLQNGLLEADYIVVEMAREILGENWMPEYVQRANGGGIERVLV